MREGVRYPGLDSAPWGEETLAWLLAPHPPPQHTHTLLPLKLGKLSSGKLFNHLQLKILMHILYGSGSTCFYLIFHFMGRGLASNYCGPRSLLPSSEIYFYLYFLNNVPLNRSFEYFYYLILLIFLQTGWGGEEGATYPGLGSLPHPPPHPWKFGKLRSDK